MKKENILIFNFDAHKPPVFKEAKGKDYYLYGSDKTPKEWYNRYPDYLIDLYNKSSKHNAIINGKTNFIAGRGWILDDTVTKLNDKVLLSSFINHPGADSLFELTKKIVKDEVLIGGFALEVVLSKDGKKLIVNHLDFGNIRLGLDNETYFYTSDWSTKKPEQNEDYTEYELFPWDESAEKEKKYLIYYKSYRPNLKEYPLPSYIGGIPYIEADGEIANFVLNNVKNGFSAGTIVNFHSGEPTEDAKAYIETAFKKKFSGTDKAGNQMFIFDDGKERGVDVIPIDTNGQDDRFLNLNDQIQAEVFTSHGSVNPSLFGIKTESGLGNNADEIRTATEFLYTSYVEPQQRIYEQLFNQIASFMGLPTGLKIERIAPITSDFSEATLAEVMTTAEIREKAGLPVLEAQESGGAADALATLSPLVATKVLDNMTTEEIRGLVGLKGSPSVQRTETKFASEMIDHAFSTLGFSDDEIEVVEVLDIDYNPFDFADVSSIDSQIIDILKANPESTVEEIAQQVGETPKQVQARINRLIQNNLLEPTDNAHEVTEEGEDEVTELITVYKYIERPDAPALRTESRDWCKARLRDSKSYTREEILSMVNTFGQSAFNHRGGWYTNPNTGTRTPFCRHIWSARTVKVKKNA